MLKKGRERGNDFTLFFFGNLNLHVVTLVYTVCILFSRADKLDLLLKKINKMFFSHFFSIFIDKIAKTNNISADFEYKTKV